MNELSETEKAYLAGLIDGEGCLTITKQQPIGHERTPVYTGMLIISMTCKEVLDRVMEITGSGKLFLQSRGKMGKNWSDCYRWVVSAKPDLCRIIRAILPYLIVKKAEAEILLEYLSLPRAYVPGKHATPIFYTQQRERYFRCLQDLKTRGKGLRDSEPKPELPPMEDPQLAFGF